MAGESCNKDIKDEDAYLTPMSTDPGRRLFPYPNLSKEDMDHMYAYKCRSEDHGVLNNYVLNHFYDFVVEKLLPSWLAPNVLTLSGPVPLVIMASLNLLLPSEYTKPETGGIVYIVLNVFSAFAVYWFLTMDNIDGKHARRIRCCSPLGDWLDHALDIVSYVSIATSFAALSNVGSQYCWDFSIVALLSYSLAIWEAQLINELIIHPVEGCSEGMFLLGTMHLVYALFKGSSAMFQKVAFVMPESQFLSYLSLSGRPITVFFLFMAFEYTICGVSFFAVADVVKRLSKREPMSRIFSSILGFIVPQFITVLSSAMFNHFYPEARELHPAANVLQLAAPSIFSIYVCNICRLMGWRFTIVETFTRPYTLIFAALPWILRLVLPMVSPATVLLISATCSAGTLLFWFFSITFGIKNLIGIPLLRVFKQREEKQE